MTPTRFRAAVIRALAVILAVLVAAALWLLSTSAIWSKGTATPFTPLAWSDATQWWLANWWVSLWRCRQHRCRQPPLPIILFALFQFWRLSYRGKRRLKARQSVVRPVERGITDNHGHSQWRSLGDAKKRFPGPDAVHGGTAVGEAYRVDHDQSVAGIPFDPADKSSWGMGGKAPLLVDLCTHGSGHSPISLLPR
jgi:type IV secretion system protein VirD4